VKNFENIGIGIGLKNDIGRPLVWSVP